MSAVITSQRDQVALRIYKLVQQRAKRPGSRVNRLRGASARAEVLNGAVARLIASGIVPPSFRGVVTLIDRALAAECRAYTRKAAASGGTPRDAPVDPDAWEELARRSEGGEGEWEADPAVILERLEAEDAIETAFAKVRADSEKIVRQALDAYSETLHLSHRKALELIHSEPKLTNKEIAARVKKQSVRGISERTVSQLRESYLSRKVEALEGKERARRAARRRDEFLKTRTVEEYEAFRKFAALFQAAGEGIDTLFAAAVRGPRAET